MSKVKWFARAPATQRQGSDSKAAGDSLPDVFAPPEVIHGSGGEADWALWDECVAAWDQVTTTAAAKPSTA